MDLELEVKALKEEINKIAQRNSRVENQKLWETSRTRLICVTLITYITMVPIFSLLGSKQPMLDALIPTAGFFISTLSLSFIKKIWEKKFN